MSQKSSYSFFSKFRQRFFLQVANFRRLKKRILRGLWDLYLHSHFQMGFWGKTIEKNHQKGPIFLQEMVHHRTKYSACTKYSAFWFRCQKFFSHDVHECLSCRIIKNNLQNKFWFLTCKLLFAKKSGTHTFSPVAWAANNLRRFLIWNLKGLWHTHPW